MILSPISLFGATQILGIHKTEVKWSHGTVAEQILPIPAIVHAVVLLVDATCVMRMRIKWNAGWDFTIQMTS